LRNGKEGEEASAHLKIWRVPDTDESPEANCALCFKMIVNPIPLSSLMGLSIGNVEVSPLLKGMPIFEAPGGVLERIRS
jgi:hypothetical protein